MKIKPYIWKLIKNTSFLKDIGFSLYHILKKNRKCIQGHGNIIDIQSDDNPPQLQNVFFDIVGDENLIIIKPGASIKNFKIHLRVKKHQVLIEENVRIKSGLFWFNDEQGKIFIGKGTTIRQAEVGIAESGTSVTIGEDCMLAGGIEIRTGDSHSIINLSNQKRLNPARNIQIGNHVWIAKYVQILKGVSIGCNSIIGIRSVVTKDIPENSLAVGIPAKVSKTDVSWTREKIRV